MSLTEELNARLRLPVIGAPLFIVSNPALVIAQCTAGVVGSFPSLNARPLSQLDEWLHEITETLAAWDRDHPDSPAAPFAVNQIVHKSNDRLHQDLELCEKYRAPLVITSLGAREDVNDAVHGWGGHVFHDVIHDRFGRKAIEKGADGLIAVAAGAGGHAGRLSPFALVQELRAWFDGPIALSGAIAGGETILAAQAAGADFAYIGSLFIASAEANAVDRYKQMIVASRANDIVYSNLFTGVHGNYLRASIEAAGLDPDALPEGDPSTMKFGSGGSSKSKAWRDIWGCGQGIGGIDQVVPASEHVDRLAREYAFAKTALDGRYRAQREADRPSVISGGRSRTHEQIRRRAARAAEGFRRLGVGQTGQDTVALCLRNDFAFFEASLGANLAGAYPVPINWHATADEAGYVLEDCRARVLVAHADLVARIAPGIPDHVTVLAVATPAEIHDAYGVPEAHDAIPVAASAWDDWLNSFDAIAAPIAAQRPAVVYTSGTTGRPKGVMREPAAPASMQTMLTDGYGLRPGRPMTVLMTGPMYHSAPNSYARHAFNHAARIVLQPRFDAEQLLVLVERYRVTHMHIVPTMFMRLLKLPADVRERHDLSSLQCVVHGAAPCPPAVKQAMIDWWGPVIREYYGSTETGLVTAIDSDQSRARPGSVGRALSGVDVEVLDDNGRALPPGAAGDVYIRSAHMPDFTYIGRDDERAAIDRAGFVTLGDIGYLDADGYLFLCDRRRDMIISGGVNIYPAEIEAALAGVPGVADSAVFGVPDDEFGEAVCACVEPEPGAALQACAIRAALADRLSRFKLPASIHIVNALPREDSGKIYKRKLREPFWAQRDSAIV